jgi:hypothetical protein
MICTEVRYVSIGSRVDWPSPYLRRQALARHGRFTG